MQNKPEYKILKKQNLPKSEVELEVEIPYNEVEKYWNEAVKRAGSDLELPGFRKGKVPEKMILETLGEHTVLEEASEMALSLVYPEILMTEKIEAIGRPQISLVKIAKNNPLVVKIKTAIVPEIKLPDYKKIAKEVKAKPDDSVDVTEKELEDAIAHILKSGGDEKAELTDELVKKLGAFENVDDFKNKLKKLLGDEKVHRNKDKKRAEIGEKIVEEAKIELPDVVVESEIDKIEAEFSDTVARLNVKLEDYLKQAKKTREEMRNEMRKDAEKRASLQFCLNEIAKKEELKPNHEDVEKFAHSLLARYPDANHENAHVYAESVLMNDEVFKFLEK